MKKSLGFALLLLVLSANYAYADAKKVLHLYTWADYIKPELVQRFEKEQLCKVVIDTFDSNESMYAKLKAGATGYDLITPSSYMAGLMAKQGMLQKIQPALVLNSAHLDPSYLKIALDPKLDYSVPYMITYTGMGYLQSRVKDFKPSWAMFERPDLKSRTTFLNDMRETVGAALKYLGYSLNTTNTAELDAAKAVVLKWKKLIAKFENEQYKTGLASGEFNLVHGYSGDILKMQEENDDVAFALPEEGFSVSSDDFVIPAGAKEVDLAHRFINFLHDPKVAAENTEFIQYLCPNKASYQYLPQEIRDNPGIFPSEALLKKGEVIRDLGDDNAKWIKIWDEIKATE